MARKLTEERKGEEKMNLTNCSFSVINQLALHPNHYNINDLCKLRSAYLPSFIFPSFPPY